MLTWVLGISSTSFGHSPSSSNVVGEKGIMADVLKLTGYRVFSLSGIVGVSNVHGFKGFWISSFRLCYYTHLEEYSVVTLDCMPHF